MTQLRASRLAVLLVAVLIVTAAAAPTAVAASDDDEEDSILDRAIGFAGTAKSILEDPGAALDEAIAGAKGLYANAKYRSGWGDPERTPGECVEDIQTEYNQHNTTYEAYANSRITATADRDVVKLTCELEVDDDLERESVYFVANASAAANGTFQNTTVVTETDRVVDQTVVLSGLATEELPDDFENFTEDYAMTDETPSRSYGAGMKAKYAGHIHGSFEFLPDEEDDS